MKNRKEYELLKAHLNLAWLRPESALWDAVASTLISKYKVSHPSLDLGCGNGYFTFLTAGGNFSIDYDWYVNVDTQGFWENEDIYDVCKVNNLKKYIIKIPKYNYTCGLDHKPNLLKQARALSFYQNLLKHDANKLLPFKDEKFMTVFSNILYWLDDLGRSLGEINRILKDNGVAILCMPDTNFYKTCFTYNWKEKNSELLRLLNRGRSECMHFTISYDDFSALSKKAGFKIIDHKNYLSPLTLKVWDIGLRPLSPVLISMANKLSLKDRRQVKSEWIDTAMKFMLPLYDNEKKESRKGGFHLFVLKKSKYPIRPV